MPANHVTRTAALTQKAHNNMDKDKDSSEGEAQGVTLDPGIVAGQARVTNVFDSFNNKN